MKKLFMLQSTLDAQKVTDDELSLAKTAQENGTLTGLVRVRKKYDQQQAKQARRKNLLDPAKRPALSAGPTLSLTTGSRRDK